MLILNPIFKKCRNIKGFQTILNYTDSYVYSEKESNTNTLKRLKKLIKENEKTTENLVKALKAGKTIDVISAQIEKRQTEKQNLEAELAKEKILNPKLEFAQVKFFFERFRKGDINNIKFRRALIDTFINKIYVFEDKLHIFCNVQEPKIEASISDSKCSPMENKWWRRGELNPCPKFDQKSFLRAYLSI